MRWLVEVSRVSDGSSTERYCIDARRWQSALQEVRRLRGDEGPLPKLTIELLDTGYRAIDPELKVRYVVSEAPADMPVTAGAQVRNSIQPPPGDEAAAVAKVPSPAKAAAISTAQAADAKKVSVPTRVAGSPSIPVGSPLPSDAPGGLPPAQVIRQRDESPTAESPIHYRELALAVRPGVGKEAIEALLRARLDQARTSLNAGEAQQYVQIAVFDHMFVKRPVRPPIATLAWKNWRGDAELTFPGFAPKANSSPSSPAASTRPPSWTSPSDAPQAAKPSVSPALVVAVGSAAPIASAPAPVVAPVALAPVFVPAASAPTPAAAALAPAPAASAPVPRPGTAQAPSSPPEAAATRASVIPAPVVAVGVRTGSEPAPAPESPRRPKGVEGPESGDVEIPVPLVARAHPAARHETPHDDELEISVEVAPPSAPAIDIEVPPPSAPVIDVALESMPSSEIPVSESEARPALETERPRSVPPPKPTTVPPPKPTTVPPGKPSSVPPSGPRRRAPGEDLIGDLFERMHELAFMADLVSGADFVVRVLGELIPCEGIIVHVFDLGKREFVVVRAHGPNARDTLLHRTADDEPLVRDIMSKRGAVILNGAPENVPPTSNSLSKLGVKPRAMLCGAARLGGRYLGLIELANPAGEHPFHDGEANALDYVCEQFAEFVASRPIVLDPDVVVGA